MAQVYEYAIFNVYFDYSNTQCTSSKVGNFANEFKYFLRKN